MENGMTLDDAKEIADNYLREQFPASFLNEYPADLVLRVAKYMIAENESVARAYQYC